MTKRGSFFDPIPPVALGGQPASGGEDHAPREVLDLFLGQTVAGCMGVSKALDLGFATTEEHTAERSRVVIDLNMPGDWAQHLVFEARKGAVRELKRVVAARADVEKRKVTGKAIGEAFRTHLGDTGLVRLDQLALLDHLAGVAKARLPMATVLARLDAASTCADLDVAEKTLPVRLLDVIQTVCMDHEDVKAFTASRREAASGRPSDEQAASPSPTP